jgi:hypothetical protein
LPRSPPHFACSMDDGALLLSTARSPVSTCDDSTAYYFANRQKSPTNNLSGQRISHTVLTEFPDASLRTSLDSPRENNGNLGREKGHAQSNITPLVSSWLPGSGVRPLAEFAVYACD